MRLGLVAASLCVFSSVAFAGGLAVSPISVELGGKASAMLVNMKNSGGESRRYQLEMMKWGESPSGQMELSPTHDIVFFPQLLTLGPGEERNVRVGITHPAGAVERSYRLFIQELPGMKTPGKSGQVEVLTRVGIPIFVVPANAQHDVSLSAPKVSSGKATFALTNQGNAHARPSKVVFTAADAEGRPVFEKSWSGWYLLAGGERDYTIQIPAEACKHATTFRAEALGLKLSLSKNVQAPQGACGS